LGKKKNTKQSEFYAFCYKMFLSFDYIILLIKEVRNSWLKWLYFIYGNFSRKYF